MITYGLFSGFAVSFAHTLGVILLCAFPADQVSAQTTAPKATSPCTAARYAQFDFWLGDWEVRWQSSSGQSGIGRNKITREYGGCVVSEHYQDVTTDFAGLSILGYSGRAGSWQQTWMDNRGASYASVGKPTGEDDGRIVMEVLRTSESAPAFRIVFEDIQPNSLTWRFQSRTSSTSAWTDLTLSHYRRCNRREPC